MGPGINRALVVSSPSPGVWIIETVQRVWPGPVSNGLTIVHIDYLDCPMYIDTATSYRMIPPFFPYVMNPLYEQDP